MSEPGLNLGRSSQNICLFYGFYIGIGHWLGGTTYDELWEGWSNVIPPPHRTGTEMRDPPYLKGSGFHDPPPIGRARLKLPGSIWGAPIPVLSNTKYLPIVDKRALLIDWGDPIVHGHFAGRTLNGHARLDRPS